jgi:RNA polymerase sigma-70 factor (ECF subfamily)
MGTPVEKELRSGKNVPRDVREWFGTAGLKSQAAPFPVRQWFAEMLQANYRLFFGIAYGYFENPAHAEDVVQSAALKALQRLGQLKQPETVVAWFASITRNTCLDVLRDKEHRGSEPLERAELIVDPRSIDPASVDQQRLLLSEINRLPDNLATVVRLRFLEDCDIVEIAERLGLRRNTVEVRLHRALAKLAKSRKLQALRRRS